VTCIVTATNAAGSASATSNTLAILAAPTNTVAPAITGTAAVGQTITCALGTWTGSPTLTRQWQRNGVNLAGHTASTYITVTADGGTSLTCVVTATNASGTATATSNALAIVGPPANTTAPSVTGTATVGNTLSCSTGTWTNSPTSYAYQWQGNTVAISGATNSTYVLQSTDSGTNVRCQVTATNASGSASAFSNVHAIP